MSSRPKIAIVMPEPTRGDGVTTLAAFLHRVASDSGRFEPSFVSLATSMHDACSVRLTSPLTWLSRPRITHDSWRGFPKSHVGAVLSEIEFQRYKPRRELTRLLSGFDLVQVVAGAPAWAYATLPVGRPKALLTATLAGVERKARLVQESGLRRLWMAAMTRLVTPLEYHVLRQMDAVFVINRWMHDHASTLISKARVHFAPPGIDTDLFHPRSYQADGYILSVGRFSDPRKNVRLLFDAYAQARSALPSLPDLLLVGQAPSTHDMAYLSALGAADHVRILTDVAAQELAECYRGARVFVLSSNEEGLGIVILEAMASGLPVVSTDCGGPSTSVVEGETGFLVPVGQPLALASAITLLASNPTLARQMGQAGCQRVQDSFSLAAAGRAFLSVYQQLLSAPR